jgi:hypothetical protein
LVKDRTFWYWGGDDGDGGEDLRGWEFLNRDFLVWDEGFEQWVLKGRKGGPVFFVELLAVKGFLGKFEEGVGDWGVGRGSVVLLSCEEGVVDVVRGSTREDEVGGVWWGEEGYVGVGILDSLEGGGGVRFVEGVEFRPRGGGGSRGRH